MNARGFTLLELMMSAVIGTVLIASMVSLVRLAGTTAPDRTRAADQVTRSGAGLEQFGADLALANRIRSATSTSLEFEVPDRDGDNAADVIRYEWGGAGEDVVRITSGGKATLIPGVQQFLLSYTTRTTVTRQPSQSTTNAEALVSTFSGSLVYGGNNVTSTSLVGQNIRPNFGSSVRTWKITRAQIYAMKGTRSGPIIFELRVTGADGLPTSSVLAQTTVAAPTLSASYSMFDVSFTDCPSLLPNQEVSLVVKGQSTQATITIGSATLSVAASAPVVTSSDGTTWSSSLLGTIPHNVWATTTQSASSSTSTKSLVQVAVQLQTSANGSTVRTSFVPHNEPEVQ